jgi:hypothetical protein
MWLTIVPGHHSQTTERHLTLFESGDGFVSLDNFRKVHYLLLLIASSLWRHVKSTTLAHV